MKTHINRRDLARLPGTELIIAATLPVEWASEDGEYEALRMDRLG